MTAAPASPARPPADSPQSSTESSSLHSHTLSAPLAPGAPHSPDSRPSPADPLASAAAGTPRPVLETSPRGILLLAGAPLLLLTAVCGAFLVAGVSVPGWAVVVGRWLPALVSLVVLWPALRRPRGVRDVLVPAWGLRRGRGTRMRATLLSAVGIAVVFVVAVMTAALSDTVGAMTVQPWGDVALGLALMVPLIPVLALSTLGEEVVWRSHLPQLLGGTFWRRSFLIALVWAVFHVPLHLTYVLQGDLSLAHAAATTAGLIPLSLFLSALTARQGSVWPAALAHAAPVTGLTLAQNAATIDPTALWTITLLGGVLMLSAAMALAPSEDAHAG
jgi:membrane protease YdiL (CAAX protease family)